MATQQEKNIKAFNDVQKSQNTGKEYVTGKGVVSKPSVITSSNARDTTNKNLKDLGTMSKTKIISNDPNSADAYATKLLDDAANAPKTAYQLAYERQSKGLIKQIDSLSSNLDSNSRSLMDSIKGEYADLVSQQENTNKAYEGGINVEGMVSGRERYASNIQGGIVANAINYGIKQVANIQNQKNKALAEAENARIQGQFQLMSKKMEVARQLAVDERDAINTTLERTRVAKEEFNKNQEDYASTLAPAVVGQLTGNAEQDYQFISETALGTGGRVSPERLYKAVTDYQNKLRQAEADAMSPLIKEYNNAVSGGYKGTIMQYVSDKSYAEYSGQRSVAATNAANANKGDAIYQVLRTAGIPAGSDVMRALAELPLNVRQGLASEVADLQAAGDTVGVNRLIAATVFQNSSQTNKDEFTVAASGVPNIDRILGKLQAFKDKNPDALGGVKNAKEYLKRAAQMTNDQDFIDLASDIGLTQVQIRNKFFGSALTGTEQGVAEGFLVQFNIKDGDSVDNMITKMTNLKGDLISRRQAVISSYVGADPTSSSTGSGGMKLKDPKTGEVRVFDSLSPEDLKDALSQGYIKL